MLILYKIKKENKKEKQFKLHMHKNIFLAHKINHEYIIKNDPSAGSPTETLLRLLLPLENLICKF